MSEASSPERVPIALRAEALEQLLTERGLVDPVSIDEIIQIYQAVVGPMNGAKVIAKAWTDPDYRQWLLADGTAAIAELGFRGPPEGEHIVVVENTAETHNVIVCTFGQSVERVSYLIQTTREGELSVRAFLNVESSCT
jgi:nitrile hydratase subunit alpha